MSVSVGIGAGRSNPGTDHPVGGIRPAGRRIGRVMQFLHGRFGGHKVAAETASRASASVRAAERWLAGTRGMSGETLLRLLASDVGAELVIAIAADLPDQQRLVFFAKLGRAARRAELSEKLRRQRAALAEFDLAGPADFRRTTRV